MNSAGFSRRFRFTIYVLAISFWATGFSGRTEDLSFPLVRSQLDGNLQGMPLMEGGLRFGSEAPLGVIRLPEGLLEVEYASIPYGAQINVLAVRGKDPNGTSRLYFDRDSERDFSDEEPVELRPSAEGISAVIPLEVFTEDGGIRRSKATEIVLIGRKQGKLEYHFNERWDTVLEFGGESLKVALQRWPFLFLDVNQAGSYEKPFFVEREILALGGKFFQVKIDFSAERLRLEETERIPVDEGFPAPEFESPIWGKEETFKLSGHKGKFLVLVFWSPLCGGSKAEAPLYSRLADTFKGDSRIRFLAVVKEEKELTDYFAKNSHSCEHIVSSELWERYGVTAPFVAFVIDGKGKIRKRFFEFQPELSVTIKKILDEGSRNSKDTSHLPNI